MKMILITLTPLKGNVHKIESLQDSIFLDILIPDYDNESIFCNFYKYVRILIFYYIFLIAFA
jgi:hypothetical protein